MRLGALLALAHTEAGAQGDHQPRGRAHPEGPGRRILPGAHKNFAGMQHDAPLVRVDAYIDRRRGVECDHGAIGEWQPPALA